MIRTGGIFDEKSSDLRALLPVPDPGLSRRGPGSGTDGGRSGGGHSDPDRRRAGGGPVQGTDAGWLSGGTV